MKEISKETAIENLKSLNLSMKMLIPVEGHTHVVYSLSDLIDSAKFFIDSKDESIEILNSEQIKKSKEIEASGELAELFSDSEYEPVKLLSTKSSGSEFNDNDDKSTRKRKVKLSRKEENEIDSLVDDIIGDGSCLDDIMRHTNKNDVMIDTNESSDECIRQLGYKAKENKIRKITIDLGKLYSLKRAGWTIKNIAQELRCSISTVRRYIYDTDLENEVILMQQNN